MPKLWTDTIEAHRQQVREAILETTSRLVAEHGLPAVTMSQIAQAAGIGRATLYKYFPDVEAILSAWHEQHVTAHLTHIAAVRAAAADPGTALRDMANAYAMITHHRQGHGADLTALLHKGEGAIKAEQQLIRLFREAITAAAKAGNVRDDVPAGELAAYCLHALSAAATLRSSAAVARLVTVTLAALEV